MTILLEQGRPVGGIQMAKPKGTSKMPSSPTVKLDKKMFEDVWWICRVEKSKADPDKPKPAAELLLELAGVQAAARRKRHEAIIAKLIKNDEAEDQIVAQAQGSAEE